MPSLSTLVFSVIITSGSKESNSSGFVNNRENKSLTGNT